MYICVCIYVCYIYMLYIYIYIYLCMYISINGRRINYKYIIAANRFMHHYHIKKRNVLRYTYMIANKI